MDTITACENVCRDFSGFANFLAWLGRLISNIGPALALAGAVWMFFRKLKEDRRDVIRQDRVRVYKGFIGLIDVAYAEAGDPHEKIELGGIWTKLYSEVSQVELVGPVDVTGKSHETHAALIRLKSPNLQALSDERGRSIDKRKSFFNARDELLSIMKAAIR
ncbi:MAG: hypothetical protein ACU0CA_00975 [Paracoccaceae bacterium]